jgi:hypothetical protein
MAKLPESKATTVAKFDAVLREQNLAGKPFRGHLGCSVIGRECERELWYAFRGCVNVAHEGRLLRLFDRGHREEEALVRWLRLADVVVHDVDPVTGEQFGYKTHGGHFAGSMDGCCLGLVEAPKTWHCLEFKTSGDRPFRNLAKHGCEKSKPEHFAQMQLYMHLSGMTRAYYLVVNKNNDELYHERVRYDDAVAVEMLEKARRIITGPTPPPRISESPAYYKCGWCDFADVCHQTSLPLVHCRTCLHATAELDGDSRWSCALHKSDRTLDEQAAGCAGHRYIPSLLGALARPVNADSEANWVEYELLKDGTLFRNGDQSWLTGAGFSSESIRVNGEQLAGKIDQTAAALRSMFVDSE